MTIVRTFEVPEQRRGKRYLLVLVPYFMVLILITVWVNNVMVGYGEKLDTFDKLQQSLTLENKILQVEISKNAALQKIASKSATLGLSKPKNIEYIP